TDAPAASMPATCGCVDAGCGDATEDCSGAVAAVAAVDRPCSSAITRPIGSSPAAGSCVDPACAVVVAGAGAGGCTAEAAAATGADGPSSGHSSTRRTPSAPVSSRGPSATTGLAMSNTSRAVPGTGCPVRTDLTTPL